MILIYLPLNLSLVILSYYTIALTVTNYLQQSLCYLLTDCWLLPYVILISCSCFILLWGLRLANGTVRRYIYASTY